MPPDPRLPSSTQDWAPTNPLLLCPTDGDSHCFSLVSCYLKVFRSLDFLLLLLSSESLLSHLLPHLLWGRCAGL